MKIGTPSILIALLLVGCNQRPAAEVANESGLTLPPLHADVVPDDEEVEPAPGTLLAELREAIKHQEKTPYLQMPPPARPIEQTVKLYGTRYPGWETDRIDASSFEALTASLNQIISKMPPAIAQDFDRVVKYVLMQSTKDPLVAKKAAIGGQVSDQELLMLVQSYMDGRSPSDVVVLAEQMKARENGLKTPPRVPDNVPVQAMSNNDAPPGF